MQDSDRVGHVGAMKKLCFLLSSAVNLKQLKKSSLLKKTQGGTTSYPLNCSQKTMTCLGKDIENRNPHTHGGKVKWYFVKHFAHSLKG